MPRKIGAPTIWSSTLPQRQETEVHSFVISHRLQFILEPGCYRCCTMARQSCGGATLHDRSGCGANQLARSHVSLFLLGPRHSLRSRGKDARVLSARADLTAAEMLAAQRPRSAWHTT